MVGLVYKENPIKEVICEFHFYGDPKWDWTVPGAFYEQVKNKFPKKREIRVNRINVSFDGGRQNSTSENAIDALQFLSEDEEELVQIAKSRLSINRRGSYKDWESYAKLIYDVLERYKKIRQNDLFKAFSLQYINIIEDISTEEETREFFSVYPSSSSIITAQTGHWNMYGVFNIELQDSETSRITIHIVPHRVEKEEKRMSWLLDINMESVLNTPAELDKIKEFLAISHQKILETFEECITERLRKLFRGEVETSAAV